MDTTNFPFELWETLAFAFMNAFPYMVLVLYAFRARWRFGRGVTFALVALLTVIQLVATPLRIFNPVGLNPAFEVAYALLYVAFIFLLIRAYIGKLVFTVLVMVNLGNLVNVLSKCLEGMLFPAWAPLRYHFTYPLVMLIVELVLLPLIYLLIFRSMNPSEPEEDVSGAQWRYLWLIPAVFYLIWMQHFYASGRSALENSLDVISTGYLLLIDAGSVLIYRLIIQLVRTQSNNRRLMAENHALSLQSVQYENLLRRIEETRQARHDLRHHIMLLKNIYDRRDLAALGELLGSYPDLEQPLVYCRNEMVSAIFAHFGGQAAERGIRYTVQADIPEDVFVEKPDLAVLFGNLLENAVEACSHGEDGRFIAVSAGVDRGEDEKPRSLSVTVKNSCFETPEVRESGVFRSTKHAGDGIGISSVRSIAERYHGVSAFGAEDGVFTASVVLYPRS